MPYSSIIERLISAIRRRSSEAPVVTRLEHDLLGDVAAQQHLHVVEQVLLRHQVAVLLGQVERVAERLSARHDRDLVHLRHRGEQLRDQRVTGLVVGDDPLLARRDHAARLQARDDPLESGVEVDLR